MLKSQVRTFQLGPPFYLFKNRESTRSYRKSAVLKRKQLIGIVTQINRMKNHWKTITSEWETFNFFRFAIKLFLFPSFTAPVFQHVTYIFAQIHVSALRNEDSYKKKRVEIFFYLSLDNITLNWSNKTKKRVIDVLCPPVWWTPSPRVFQIDQNYYTALSNAPKSKTSGNKTKIIRQQQFKK